MGFLLNTAKFIDNKKSVKNIHKKATFVTTDNKTKHKRKEALFWLRSNYLTKFKLEDLPAAALVFDTNVMQLYPKVDFVSGRTETVWKIANSQFRTDPGAQEVHFCMTI